jgi:hypothetical protein
MPRTAWKSPYRRSSPTTSTAGAVASGLGTDLGAVLIEYTTSSWGVAT